MSHTEDLTQLTDLLGLEELTVADRNIIPLGVVLALADLLDVDPGKGTAEERLRVLIDEAGLVDDAGVALTFPDKHSASIAGALTQKVHEVRTQQNRRLDRSRKPSPADDRFHGDNARTKKEAVNRISELTDSGPEELGPGSKERKSVLENLYRGLGFGEPPKVSKSELGRILAENLDIEWDHHCHSTGETIRLTGLNRLLAAATDFKFLSGYSPAGEAALYADVILQEILTTAIIEGGTARWDGRASVTEMIDRGSPNARQTEWPGWYFEHRVLDPLVEKFGGGPHRVGSTTFDYRGKRTWDLKVHSDHGRTTAPLNDLSSVQQAAAEDGGIGFIVLRGNPSYQDEDAFYTWHNHEIRGHPPKERSTRSRRLKTGFQLERVDFYQVGDVGKLSGFEEAGILTVFSQGRQQSGAARPPKYRMDLALAERSDFLVHSVDIPAYLGHIE